MQEVWRTKGKSMRTILDDKGQLKYLAVEKKRHKEVFYNSHFEKISPKWMYWNTNLSRHGQTGQYRVLSDGNDDMGLFNLETQKFIYTPPYEQIELLGENLVSLKKDGLTAVANMGGKMISDYQYSKISKVTGGYIIATLPENKGELILNKKGKSLFNMTYRRASINAKISEPDTTIYFSVMTNNQVENPSNSQTLLLDQNGKILVTLPDSIIYRVEKGPLDILEKQERRYKTYTLVKDLTTDTICKCRSVQYMTKADKNFYICFGKRSRKSNDIHRVFNEKGELLFEYPSYKLLEQRAKEGFMVNHFFISGRGRYNDVDLFDLEGHPLILGAQYKQQNSFGQEVFEVHGQQQFFDLE